MRIESLEIENFRSIRSLKLEGLGPINVFYGENGAGKSNILAAVELLFSALKAWTEAPFRGVACPVPADDFAKPLSTRVLKLRASLLRPPGEEGAVQRIELEVVAPPLGAANLSRLFADGRNVLKLPEQEREEWWFADLQLPELRETANAYRLTQAVRQLEAEPVSEDRAATGADRIARLLREGRLKQALVEAVTNPDIEVRTGLKRMQDVFRGPPLNRPHFDPVHDPAANRYELNEIHYGPKGRPYAIPVDLAGLGVQQIYHVMAAILLGGAAIVAVEEPEAHLHPRTSGMQLRELLKRSVDEGHVDQLFIATHSNLFDLDPTGYFLVRNDPDRGTVVERRADFAELDREVFWEPGPARSALLDMLRYLPPDTVVFRRPDGAPIPANEMLALLQADDPVAVSFVDDVQATAVRSVQRLAQRGKRES